MHCSVCNHDESIVIRTDAEDQYIRRRRECCRCHHRWNTFETPANVVEELQRIKDIARPLADLVG